MARLLKVSAYLAIFIVLCLTISGLVASPARTETSRAENGVRTIKGFIEHKEVLPPVNSNFKTGATLSNAQLPRFFAGNTFYPIPRWLAGRWLREQQLTNYSYDYKSQVENRTPRQSTARGDEEFGWQRDRVGGIWQYTIAPFTTIVKGDGQYTVQICRELEPLSVSEKQLVVRFRGTDLSVEIETNRILSTNQIEKLQVYTQSSYGAKYCNCIGSIKSFDQDGKPLRLSQVATVSIQTEGFTPTDSYDGKDIRPLFKQSLLSRGYQKLVPLDEKAATAATTVNRKKPVISELRATQGKLDAPEANLTAANKPPKK